MVEYRVLYLSYCFFCFGFCLTFFFCVFFLCIIFFFFLYFYFFFFFFFFSSRRRHTRCLSDWSSDVCSSDLISPNSTAGDFRKLTPLVLMAALQAAGTVVCEPIHRFHLEVPTGTFGAVAPLLARLRAVPRSQQMQGSSYVLEGDVPAARTHELQQLVPGLTRGEGVLECAFDRYEPISGTYPTRARTDLNPLNRKEYLIHVVRRV